MATNSNFSKDPLYIWFEDLVKSYYTRLADFSVLLCRSRELSEEIIEDVFIKVWKRKEEVYQIENLDAYLFRAVKNTALNYVNKKKKNEIIYIDNIPEFLIPANQICPEKEYISKELKLEISRAINSLPKKCKIIFKLAKIEGLKYKVIASLLDISEKTVENQISIALKKIAACLKKENFLDEKKPKGISGFGRFLFF
ncbi:MAG: RNA polymerase sigma-70 factor [Bacteroidales bacterium]|nr:RNA polymerase sigma-70 factor [Bacteroidales bacterium]